MANSYRKRERNCFDVFASVCVLTTLSAHSEASGGARRSITLARKTEAKPPTPRGTGEVVRY